MKASKIFFFALLTGIMVSLFSCRKEEPSDNRDEPTVPCDTCEVAGDTCSFDTSLFRNRWWVQDENGADHNIGYYFSSEYESGGYYQTLYQTSDGNFTLTNENRYQYHYIGCDSVEISITGFTGSGIYKISTLDSLYLDLYCPDCNPANINLYHCASPDSIDCN